MGDMHLEKPEALEYPLSSSPITISSSEMFLKTYLFLAIICQ